MCASELQAILKNNISTLKETSKDDHDGQVKFMVQSPLVAVDFDGVKDEYIASLGLREAPKSNDALFFDDEGRVTFIEFKSGYIDAKKSHDIRKKIFDSLLIYLDIIGQGISYTRENMDYILVYNGEKNAIDEMGKLLMKKAGSRLIKYNLHIFEKYCFSNVYTYTVTEFVQEFSKKTSGILSNENLVV